MLRTYGPGCDGSIVEANSEKIPDGATWIDLEEPTGLVIRRKETPSGGARAAWGAEDHNVSRLGSGRRRAL